MTWQNGALVALGGALGSVLRWAVIVLAAGRFGAGFPWGTLIVNIVGSFIIGIVFELAGGSVISLSPAARLFIATGICGGFTTFSTFSLDALTLSRDGAPGEALLYLAGSVAAGLVAVYLGVVTGRLVTPHG